MIGDAPRGHTSIYLCDFFKENWDAVRRYIVASGFSSFNQYTNSVLVKDFRSNYADIMNSSFNKGERRWDFYQPIPKSVKEMTVNWTDGQLLDLVHMTASWRNLLIMELKRRGNKL